MIISPILWLLSELFSFGREKIYWKHLSLTRFTCEVLVAKYGFASQFVFVLFFFCAEWFSIFGLRLSFIRKWEIRFFFSYFWSLKFIFDVVIANMFIRWPRNHFILKDDEKTRHEMVSQSENCVCLMKRTHKFIVI